MGGRQRAETVGEAKATRMAALVCLICLTGVRTAAAQERVDWDLGLLQPNVQYELKVRVRNRCDWQQQVYIDSRPETVAAQSGDSFWVMSESGVPGKVIYTLFSRALLVPIFHSKSVRGNKICRERHVELVVKATLGTDSDKKGQQTRISPRIDLEQEAMPETKQASQKPGPSGEPTPEPPPPPPATTFLDSPETGLEIPTISVLGGVTGAGTEDPPPPPKAAPRPVSTPEPQAPQMNPKLRPVSFFDGLDTFGGLDGDGQPLGALATDEGPSAPDWQNMILNIQKSLSFMSADTGSGWRQGRVAGLARAFRGLFRQPQLGAELALAAWSPGATSMAAPLPPAGAGRVVFSLVATGASTGEVFKLHVVNGTGGPVQLGGPDGLVVQAISGRAQPLAALAPRAQQQAVMGFCLDFARRPPPAGTLYQVAPRELQQKLRSLRDVFRAAQSLAEKGLLHPDGDPNNYLNFVKQWALWSKREGWDGLRFESNFLERTKKNILQLGRKWTAEMEKAVRAAAPGRWRDIQAVLQDVTAGVR